MLSFSLTSLFTAIIVSHHLTFANPLPHKRGANLVARVQTNYVDCIQDQKTKLDRHFWDAQQIA
jgi:hypothetical protein